MNKTISIILPEDMIKKLEDISIEQDRSLSSLIRLFLAEMLKQQPDRKV